VNEPKQPPRLPIVGEHVRGIGKLVEVQDVTRPPPPKAEDWIFSDTSAQVKCLANGIEIKEYSTFNNFYGEDRCVEHAIENAREVMKEIGPCDLEFIVVKTTALRRYRPTREVNYYARQFVDFRYLDSGSSHGLPDDVEEIVWWSKSPTPTPSPIPTHDIGGEG
jgi:hypothetical protein